jgi:CxxC motif-containing protein
MSTKKDITCIVCPIGCKILVEVEGKTCKIIEGNRCKKGLDYVYHEALDPKRMFTSSILVKDGEWPLVSVKSSRPVPKEKIFQVLGEIKKATVKAPVKIGQTIIQNVAKTGIDIMATKTVNKTTNNRKCRK